LKREGKEKEEFITGCLQNCFDWLCESDDECPTPNQWFLSCAPNVVSHQMPGGVRRFDCALHVS
jgi:hypothetical protein